MQDLPASFSPVTIRRVGLGASISDNRSLPQIHKSVIRYMETSRIVNTSRNISLQMQLALGLELRRRQLPQRRMVNCAPAKCAIACGDLIEGNARALATVRDG